MDFAIIHSRKSCPVNFRPMPRALFPLFFVCSLAASAQVNSGTGTLLTFSDAIALQLSKAQAFELSLRAWEYSFGQQPGAVLLQVDTANGRIEGSARVNYRSTGLGSREATMGAIVYRITIEARNGQCLVRIAQLEHTGNQAAPGGGVDLGPIYVGDRPVQKTRGISQGSAQRLHADMRDQATRKVQEAMHAFAARLRLLAAAP